MKNEKYQPPLNDIPLPPLEDRLERLEQMFFPVELRNAHWTIERFDGSQSQYYSSKFFALVHKGGNSEAFQVVTQDYRLFPYRDGYELAVEMFSEAFSQERAKVQPLRVRATTALSSCRIDLHHPNPDLEIELDGGDIWVPFVSIGNSYNKTQKVTIDLGVHLRGFESSFLAAADAVSLEDAHKRSPDEVRNEVREKAREWKFDDRLERFRRDCNHVAGLYCKPEDAIPLAILALGLNYPHPRRTPVEQRPSWVDFHQQLRWVVDHHFESDDFDPTVYTLLRALAVFLSAEKIPRIPANSRRKSLQNVGAWLHDTVERTKSGERISEIAKEGQGLHELFADWEHDSVS